MELKKQTLKEAWRILLESYEHPERFTERPWSEYACIRLNWMTQYITTENVDRMKAIFHKHLGRDASGNFTKPFSTMDKRLAFIRRKAK